MALTGMTLESPSEEPVEIEYAQWRSKRQGYEVEVLEVHHQPAAKWGYYSTVVVRGTRTSRDKRVSWPAKVFLRGFEPVGPKLKVPTRWERVKA